MILLRAVALVSACIALALPASGQTPQTHMHGFSGAEHWARMFDDPARDAWQKPHEVLSALRLAPDARVADIGAGTGYFSVRLAHMVPAGRVYAVDIERDMVRYLRERAKREKLRNLRVVFARPDDPLLPQKVDRVLIVDTYHHIGGRERYFRTLARYLRPGARVAIVDFTAASPIGPPAGERLQPAQVRAEMQAAGYELVQSFDFLPNQYFLLFRARGR